MPFSCQQVQGATLAFAGVSRGGKHYQKEIYTWLQIRRFPSHSCGKHANPDAFRSALIGQERGSSFTMDVETTLQSGRA